MMDETAEMIKQAYKRERARNELLRRKLEETQLVLDHCNLMLLDNGLTPLFTKEDITNA